ncbi:hypothetical protein AAU57_03050 [Nonlabens sp. YIK11]|uniref:hypothetical protein n=1 Tax=Nonlabens sp. YIK11 TaxID=1453349 RepID=UPI0006DC9CE5|nr:hypothetical protein [Nonlabens sp. YIK11]KQC32417.1 hypothetical protein AAU57_03050 [Nonlabens sp. YIK11]
MKTLRFLPIVLLLILSSCKKDKSRTDIENTTTENGTASTASQEKANVDPNKTVNNKSLNSGTTLSYQSAVLTPTSINFVKSDGSQDIIMFGRNENMVLEKMNALIGSPSITKIIDDCNGNPVKTFYWNENLTLNFNNRDNEWRLGGWNLQSRDSKASNYQLASGLTVNRKRKDLSKPLTVKAKKTNLGYSLNLDGVTAVLDSDADDATVTYVYSGVNCNNLKSGVTPEGEIDY